MSSQRKGSAVKEQYIDELFRVEDANWWHRAKRGQILELATRYFPADGTPALEAGAGAGRLLLDLRATYGTAAGLDMSEAALSACARRGFRVMAMGDVEKAVPFQDNSFRVVVFSDVLEHMENDVSALREAARVIKPGGGIIISAPAIPWMYDFWDKEHGHVRRYTKAALRACVESAGFEILKLTYTNFFILPPAIIVRKILGGNVNKDQASKDMVMAPAFLNRIFAMIYFLERAAVRTTGLPVGLSLVCAARKK